MDPVETLKALLNAFVAGGDRDEAIHQCDNLLYWLTHKGYMPKVVSENNSYQVTP